MTNLQHTLRSGRRIGVSLSGDPMADRVVVVCLPFATSGPFDPRPITTRHSGVQLISIDRPGYGASEPLPDDQRAAVSGFADDIAEYARDRARDGRGVTAGDPELRVVGWGFGGCVALSLAARHPHLVRNVLVADIRSPAELADGAAIRPPEWEVSEEDERFAPGIGLRLSRLRDDSAAGRDADRAAMGSPGWADDLTAITAPTTFLYSGAQDSPAAETVREYRRRIRSARVARVVESGPLILVRTWSQILRRLEVDPIDV